MVNFESFQDLSLTRLLPFVVFSALVTWHLYSYIHLSHVPGPRVASLTNLARVSWVYSNRSHEKHIELHRQYGSFVRFGPNMVSVSDPAAIPQVYGLNSRFPKSDFYRVFLLYSRSKPVPTIFATQDDELHRILKKPIGNIYSMTNVVSFEKHVDHTIEFFFKRLEQLFVDEKETCDFGKWLQMFAFDVMGMITFSKRLGFLDRGEDVDGIMDSIWRLFQKISPVSPYCEKCQAWQRARHLVKANFSTRFRKCNRSNMRL